MCWIFSILLAIPALAQTPDGLVKFEAASVKATPASPARGTTIVVRGGPGSSGPGLVTFENIDMFSLTAMAYGIQRYQLSAPEWMSNERFDINARLPQGATREEYRQMLQNLLVERFKLAVHRETKELSAYDLTVGKNGPKLEKSSDQSGPAADAGMQPPPQPSRLPPGSVGAARVNFAKIDMVHFAAYLSGQVSQAVIDTTGLTANYTIRLHYVTGLAAGNLPESAAGEPTIFQALEEQAGLKLIQKKRTAEILVVDHAEKTPTEN
jgi:uncharacterized protein (TIGR03435 family)